VPISILTGPSQLAFALSEEETWCAIGPRFPCTALFQLSALELVSMTSVTVFVHRLEPDGTRSPISIRRPWRVGAPDRIPVHEEEQTLAERVFLFLDQRSA
jgi:hypothetical protein